MLIKDTEDGIFYLKDSKTYTIIAKVYCLISQQLTSQTHFLKKAYTNKKEHLTSYSFMSNIHYNLTTNT